MNLNMKLNGDQMLSLGNYLLAGLGALLMHWGVQGDELNLAQGLFAIVMSIGLGVWMNAGNTYDIVMSVARRTLMILGVYGVAKGWVSQDTALTIVNAVIGFLPVALSMWFYRDAPGPNLAGTTVVDAPIKTLDLKASDIIGTATTITPRDGKALPT